jgi:hypothetical protein
MLVVMALTTTALTGPMLHLIRRRDALPLSVGDRSRPPAPDPAHSTT